MCRGYPFAVPIMVEELFSGKIRMDPCKSMNKIPILEMIKNSTALLDNAVELKEMETKNQFQDQPFELYVSGYGFLELKKAMQIVSGSSNSI